MHFKCCVDPRKNNALGHSQCVNNKHTQTNTLSTQAEVKCSHVTQMCTQWCYSLIMND